MGKRSIVLFVALGLAAVSAFAVWQYLAGVEDRAREDIQEVEVYRATEFIEMGTEGELARPLIVPKTALLEAVGFEGSQILCTGAVVRDSSTDRTVCDNNPRDLTALLEGNVAAGPISAGQLITADMFVSPAELNTVSLSEAIPPNKVAISVRPDDDAVSGGFIRPGDRINILASAEVQLNQFLDVIKDPELRALILGPGDQGTTTPTTTLVPGFGGPEPVDPLTALAETFPNSIQFTQTVLQDIEVLAVGPDNTLQGLGTGLTPQTGSIIVLNVTPEQAEKIEFARNYTTVALSLLPKDSPYTQFEARGVVVDDLFDLLDRIQEQLEQFGESLGG
jgi:Flp pilus assembly protein CpaB